MSEPFDIIKKRTGGIRLNDYVKVQIGRIELFGKVVELANENNRFHKVKILTFHKYRGEVKKINYEDVAHINIDEDLLHKLLFYEANFQPFLSPERTTLIEGLKVFCNDNLKVIFETNFLVKRVDSNRKYPKYYVVHGKPHEKLEPAIGTAVENNNKQKELTKKLNELFFILAQEVEKDVFLKDESHFKILKDLNDLAEYLWFNISYDDYQIADMLSMFPRSTV